MKTTPIKSLLYLSLFTFHFSFFTLKAQNVAINTTGALPNASAILDLSNSASMALLSPQVSLTDVSFLAPVPGPGPAGLIVYNTNPSTNGGSGTGYYFWDGVQWNYLLTGSTSGWSLTGNTGTNPAVNYIGTNDPEDFVFKTFSTERMRILAAGGVGIGTASPQNMLDVNGGVAIGTYAGINTAPANSVIISGQLGVGTSSPDPSASVDITSANNGFLVPRMTMAQMNAIANPATALMIYNTTTNCFMFYTGMQWQPIACICMGAPSAPGTISGNIGVCTGATGIVYSIASVSGATSYNWNVPSGANIVSGQGTTGITVNFGNDSGYVSVTASNSCGTSLATTEAISIYTTPNAPGSITGNTNPAINFSYTYTIAKVSGATSYNWSLSGSGANIVSGQGTTSISISYGATPGSYTLCVYDSNACGVSAPGPCLAITSTNCQHGTVTYSYTSTVQKWTVPGCVSVVTLTAYGASGVIVQASTAGLGAEAAGVLTVSGGDTLYIYVGGQSLWNGGGAGGTGSGMAGYNGGNGGDASDVRLNGIALSNRIIVAGGGGGAGRGNGCVAQTGGDGGYPGGYGGYGGNFAGQNGTNGGANGGAGGIGGCGGSCCSSGGGGGGGGQNGGGGGGGYTNIAAGGVGGCGTHGSDAGGGAGSSGAGGCLGVGGAGGNYTNGGGGGGGGGYWGGGAGGGNWAAGGGGGSTYIGGVSNGTTVNSIQTGNGQVILQY